jgi:hypothetical protein
MFLYHKTYKTIKTFVCFGESLPLIPNLIRNSGFPAATQLWSRPRFYLVLQVLKVL